MLFPDSTGYGDFGCGRTPRGGLCDLRIVARTSATSALRGEQKRDCRASLAMTWRGSGFPGWPGFCVVRVTSHGSPVTAGRLRRCPPNASTHPRFYASTVPRDPLSSQGDVTPDGTMGYGCRNVPYMLSILLTKCTVENTIGRGCETPRPARAGPATVFRSLGFRIWDFAWSLMLGTRDFFIEGECYEEADGTRQGEGEPR